ncbi:hypothetical protein [Sphingomonas mollis]|uniref:Uncharacterized protein n=1 Tax=Sphingomonas mollis TaxID=2795726 RepID=A0ABS0XM51_9SPHN|nr:hypothetical protein [Sphingomonas sp. BT553]MBJ6120845.1 hypothetical protein [Sphingomonas sp. BT553]
MTDPSKPDASHPGADPAHDPSDNAFDQPTGYSGQGYLREREEAEGRKHPSGHPLTGDASTHDAIDQTQDEKRDIPPDSGKRGWVDAKTGEVHGSGSGAGGGNGGEDIDAGTPGSA